MQADKLNEAQAQDTADAKALVMYPEHARTKSIRSRKCNQCRNKAVGFLRYGRRVPVCGVHAK